MSTHSPIGGSGADTWFNCPGSVALCAAFPSTSSPQAREGLCAHNLAEQALQYGVDPAHQVGNVSHDTEITAEMAEHVQGYVDYCQAQCTEHGYQWVEASFKLDQIHPLLWSTLDFATYNPTAKHLDVVDFKYGRNRVSILTKQLKIYAVGAMLKLLAPGEVETVTVHIYQPRLWGEPEQPHTYTAHELLQWANKDLYQAAHLATSDNAPRRPGKHCKYCPAKLVCPEYKQQLTQQVEAPISLSDAEIAALLPLRSTIERFFDDLNEEARQRLQRGAAIGDYKLIKRFGNSTVVDDNAAINALLQAGYPMPEVMRIERKLETLTKIKKLKGAYELVKPYVNRSEQKPEVVPGDAKGQEIIIATKAFGDTTK